jgi:hypothetical protein
VPAPQLRIVSEDVWDAAHRRPALAESEDDLATHGARQPRRDRDSAYLLIGFARCAACGRGLHVRSRKHGEIRQQLVRH